ncbi:MAG: hypothetical protein HOH46_16540 [Rhodospirillaceae bacterium]|jgi:hypothetical protein|nr:hypothetical protein [Rhodospirillaceae bacterium]
MKGNLIVVLIVVVIGAGAYFYDKSSDSSGSNSSADLVVTDIDLEQVLDVTVDTIVRVDKTVENMPQGQSTASQAFFLLSSELATAYNAATPPLDENPIDVVPLVDSSLLAYGDINLNGERDENEDALFLIEVDGQNSRIIATSRKGAVGEHRISGSGMFAGYLIGSMLSRQSSKGATAAVANKTPISATQARARARAGSGSHTRGK